MQHTVPQLGTVLMDYALCMGYLPREQTRSIKPMRQASIMIGTQLL